MPADPPTCRVCSPKPCVQAKERPERSEVHRTNAVQAFSGRLAWGDPCLSASVYWAW
jgi:hypothetical protein